MRLFGDGYRDAERRSAVCRIVWRLRPAIVDRLSRSLEVLINRLRACVTEHIFGGVFGMLMGSVVQRVCTSLGLLFDPWLLYIGGDGCHNLVSERGSVPGWRSADTIARGLISFSNHYAELVHGLICDVSVTTQFQAIAP
ncbi:hypothetical protein F2Q69_00006915 [Brassica cretica]|uniref:Uncharacterized protein n=1 Tax=Brassica cretica TaxID=69181 RepID=A0A8S9P140_BRACR|nr:hypothetical protein F2Q69_00006915 [Brassica cretica]